MTDLEELKRLALELQILRHVSYDKRKTAGEAILSLIERVERAVAEVERAIASENHWKMKHAGALGSVAVQSRAEYLRGLEEAAGVDNTSIQGMWPVIIVQDRYNGTYARGRWIAVSCADEENRLQTVMDEANGGDGEAMTFWASPPTWVAVGDDPAQAIRNLKGE